MVGKAVGYGVATGKDLADMTLDEIRQFAPNANEDVFDVLTLEGSVAARDHLGGAAPNQVRKQVQRWQDKLNSSTPKHQSQ
jgi:argininosuccinate lyase